MRGVLSFLTVVAFVVILAGRETILSFMDEHAASGYLAAALITAFAAIYASIQNARNINKQIDHAAEISREDRRMKMLSEQHAQISARLRSMKAVHAELSVLHEHLENTLAENLFCAAADRIEAEKSSKIPICKLPDFGGFDTYLSSNIDNIGMFPTDIIGDLVRYHSIYRIFLKGYARCVEQMSTPEAKPLLIKNFRSAHQLAYNITPRANSLCTRLQEAIQHDETILKSIENSFSKLHNSSSLSDIRLSQE